MADIWLSDVHLRLDKPERGLRLAALVRSLEPQDRLFIMGDLCDFWFESRQRNADPHQCVGLAALIDFRRSGGSITLMLGNHDLWLGPYYERLLEIAVTPEPYHGESHGIRLHASHGHRVRSKSWWKAAMETEGFLRFFERVPAFMAHGLDLALLSANELGRKRAEDRMVREYRRYADKLGGSTDLVLFGHVHRVHDDQTRRPRLLVLGDWADGPNYLRIDASGAAHSSSRAEKTAAFT